MAVIEHRKPGVLGDPFPLQPLDLPEPLWQGKAGQYKFGESDQMPRAVDAPANAKL